MRVRGYLVGLLLVASLAHGGCQGTGRWRTNLPSGVSTTASIENLQPAAPQDSGAANMPAQIERLPPINSAKTQTGSVQRVDYQAPEPEPKIVSAPVLPPTTDSTQPTVMLDFVTALGQTQDQNPRIAFAQAQVSQAYAQHQAARVLWLPHIRAGMNYNKHDGRLQDVAGKNIEVSRGAAYAGMGANAVGAGSPAVPGVYVNVHTTDAIFQRRISNFRWQATSAQSDALRNDQLLETALTYLALLEAAQRQAIAQETFHRGEELAKLTANFAQAGAGNQADVDRSQAVLALFHNELLRADEAVAVASARVAQQISADPTVQIIPQEPNIVPIDLVAVNEGEVTELVATGLSQRPELSASRSLVCEAVNRLERERFAPWLPSILLGTSYGSFGAGTGGNITNGADRFDLDAAAWWEVRNLGAGERAARDCASSQIQQAKMREVEMMDLIAREVVEGATQVQSRRLQMEVAQRGIQAAKQSYQRNRDRIRNAQGLPIEVLQAIQALDQAQRDYLRSLVEYNTAQFRLYRALGCPIHGIGFATPAN